MKRRLLCARGLMILCALFALNGCGGGVGDAAYTLQFHWINTSSVIVRMAGYDDKYEGGKTDLVEVLAGSTSQHSLISGRYLKSTTDIIVSLYSRESIKLGDVRVSGVHVAKNKITYIYVTYNGSTTSVDATRLPGVQR